MKKLLLIAVVVMLLLTLILAPAAYAGKKITKLIADADINTVGGAVDCTSTVGSATASSFNPEQPGNWGGEYGGGAVTAFPSDPDPAGYITLSWTTKDSAKCIKLRMLDGIADDSFDVYVQNKGGSWAWIYSYTSDPSTSEYWVLHSIKGFPSGKGNQGRTINIMIVPTNVGWGGFSTWGQLAVDKAEVWDR